MSMSDGHENLLARFIDDREALSEQDFATLLAALRADAELSRLLKDLLIIDDVCAQIHSVDRSNFRAQIAARLRDLRDGGGMRAEVLLKRFSEPRISPVQRSGFWRIAAVLAACVAIAALITLALRKADDSETSRANSPVAVLKSTAPGVRVRRGNADLAVSEEMQMLSDDTLINPLDGDVQIALSGQDSRFVLHGGTQVHLTHTPHGLRVRLAQGSVRAVLGPQPKDQPLVISTASAEISIVGTELNVAVDSNETNVEVVKGSVDVVRIDDGESIRIDANHFTRVVPGREMITLATQPAANSGESAGPKTPDSPKNEDGWRAIFDGKSLQGWRAAKGHWHAEDGCLISTSEKPLDSAALMSDDVFGNYELRFDYKVEGATYMEVRNRVSEGGSYDLQTKDDNTSWRHCVIKISGEKGTASIDGQEKPFEILGHPAAAGRIRFYMQNRVSAGGARLYLKNVEVRELTAGK